MGGSGTGDDESDSVGGTKPPIKTATSTPTTTTTPLPKPRILSFSSPPTTNPSASHKPSTTTTTKSRNGSADGNGNGNGNRIGNGHGHGNGSGNGHRMISNSTIAGAGAGLLTAIAGCPLDVIKTRLQAQEFARGSVGYKGVFETTKHVYATKGIRGFYRGLGPTILGYLPTWAIYFTVYDSVKEYFGEEALGAAKRIPDPLNHEPPPDRKKSLALHLFSAMVAGGASTICTSPLWVVKTRIMAQPLHEKPYKHTLDCFITIYRSEGPRAFYRGLLTSLLGISHVAVQFPLYEQLKDWAERRNQNAQLPAQTILLCSGAAKMVASITTYPHEVIRTRLQMQKRPIKSPSIPGMVHPQVHYRGILQTAAKIVQEETFLGLYKGLSINLARTVPSSAVTMLTYELLMRYMGSMAA